MFLSLSSLFFKQINTFLGLSQPPWVLDYSLCLVHTAQFFEAKFSTSSNNIIALCCKQVAFHLLRVTLLGSACFYSLAPCRLDATGDPVRWHGISLSNPWEQMCQDAAHAPQLGETSWAPWSQVYISLEPPSRTPELMTVGHSPVLLGQKQQLGCACYLLSYGTVG